MAARTPLTPVRRATRCAVVVVGTLCASLLAAFWLYGHRVQLRALAGARYGGFTPVLEFALRDSLPALEGGLSNLEAFKVTLAPSWKADPERSMWISDSLNFVTMEFLSEKQPLDSVTVFAWWTGGALESRTFRDTADIAWSLAPGQAVRGWSEVVAAYLSDPPLFTVSSTDPLVTLFESAEGRVMHVIGGWYLGRRLKPLKPDTSYAIAAKGEGLGLMVRGDALAVVNPTPQRQRFRVVEMGTSRTEVVEADSFGVSVFRTFMVSRRGMLLAYTNPGEPYPVFRVADARPAEIFVLRR
jgi:hypothetical protein